MLGTDTWAKILRNDAKQCVPIFCENNPFRSVVWETVPFHTALLILTTLNNECFSITTWKPDLFL